MKAEKITSKRILNRKNFIIGFLALTIMVAAAGYFMYSNSAKAPDKGKVCIGDKKCFGVEIANTPEKMTFGLSGRSSLNEDKGMIFIFEEEGIYGFWMKDMNFPLDIIWVSRDLKIAGIEKNMRPCEGGRNCPVVFPDEKVVYVLEINSGLSEKYVFETGDYIHFG